MMQGHPAVHPFQPMGLEGHGVPEAQPAAEAVPPADLPEMDGTYLGAVLRILQALSAISVLAILVSPSKFAPEFSWLAVAAVGQFVWSLLLWVLNIYALLVMRPLRNRWLLLFFATGDAIATVFVYGAAWISGGITILVAYDLKLCNENNCPSFIGASIVGFVGANLALPSFLLNLWGYLRSGDE
ncbi:unnamed protein product [Urochloa decumbens]|uniref:CASP-like protein n=1 Tax=Urochloa decumbens TaxID=240449 RepID=A0ABC8VDW7_9POAL